MAHITFNPLLLSTLKDKVVVLTGGATGIGREAVKLFHGTPSLSPIFSPFPLSSTLKTTSLIFPSFRSRSQNNLRRRQRDGRKESGNLTLQPKHKIPILRHNILHFPTFPIQNRLFPLPPNRHRDRQCRNQYPSGPFPPKLQYRGRIFHQGNRRQSQRRTFYCKDRGTFFEVEWKRRGRFGVGK